MSRGMKRVEVLGLPPYLRWPHILGTSHPTGNEDSRIWLGIARSWQADLVRADRWEQEAT